MKWVTDYIGKGSRNCGSLRELRPTLNLITKVHQPTSPTHARALCNQSAHNTFYWILEPGRLPPLTLELLVYRPNQQVLPQSRLKFLWHFLFLSSFQFCNILKSISKQTMFFKEIYNGWDKKRPSTKNSIFQLLLVAQLRFLHVLTYIADMIPVDFCNAICNIYTHITRQSCNKYNWGVSLFWAL